MMYIFMIVLQHQRGTWFCQFVDNSLLMFKIIVSVTEKQHVFMYFIHTFTISKKRERVKIICSLSSILINLNSSHSNIKKWHGYQLKYMVVKQKQFTSLFFLNECSKILIIQLRLPHRNIACLRIIAYA